MKASLHIQDGYVLADFRLLWTLKNFQMPVALEVKIAKQIGGRLEQSLHPDLSCTNQGWDVEITRLISETNAENQRDCFKELNMKLGRQPIP